MFKVGMTYEGDFVLQYCNGNIIWSAGTADIGRWLIVQSDGNVMVRRSNNQAIWSSGTYDHAGAQLVVDDGGRIAIVEGDRAVWLEGIPRGRYTGRPSENLRFPVRGMFYYPVRMDSCRCAVERNASMTLSQTAPLNHSGTRRPGLSTVRHLGPHHLSFIHSQIEYH